MTTDEDVKRFGVGDYVVFFGMLVLSIAVGIYYAIKDRKSKTMDTYYFGGRSMSPIPLGLSIAVTFISAVTIIGFPTETYLFGTVIIWFAFSSVIPTLVDIFIYIPLIHELKLFSIYKFFELRFNVGLRKLASVITCITMLVYMSMTVYIPALSLSAVTPMDLKLTIVLASSICTIYTTLGGMKAVVWTDTLQTLIMLAGASAVLIKTIVLVGGFQYTWEALERGGRQNAMTFDLDPTLRVSFWTIIVGSAVAHSGPNQAIMQRYLSCKSTRDARIAAIFSLLPKLVFMSVAVFSGAAMYAYYENCDPLTSGKIEKPDQMMPYLVVDVFQNVPGMAGLYVAAGFSGTLSTVSSGINALANLLIQDFIVASRPKLSQTARVTISKIMVLGFGLAVTALALGIQYIKGTAIRILFSFGGIVSGPMLGLFTLGMFFPWATSKGAIIGQISSTIVTAVIVIGSFFFGNSSGGRKKLPLSVEGCSVISEFNSTLSPTPTIYDVSNYTTALTIETEIIAEPSSPAGSTIFDLSFFYYGTISWMITFGVGLLASFLLGANDPAKADPTLFVPIISNPIFPAKIRKFFRFGVPELSPDPDYKDEKKLSDSNSLMMDTDSSSHIYSWDEDMKQTDL